MRFWQRLSGCACERKLATSADVTVVLRFIVTSVLRVYCRLVCMFMSAGMLSS